MSVGVVLPKQLYRRLANGSAEETLNRAISDTPIVAKLMREARREWPYALRRTFRTVLRLMPGIAGSLPGTQDRFSIPVFSTGVSIAMESGIEAAAELHRALLKNNFSAASFAAFSRASAGGSNRSAGLLWVSTHRSSATSSSARNPRT
jgi:hypothetical protein